MLLRFSAFFVDVLLRALLRIRVYGLENVPRSGPAILAFNHSSYLDPVVIGATTCRVRPFRSIGKRELFGVPLLGAFLRACGVIPVDRDHPDHSAMHEALEALRRGQLFIMAPEGTRGKSGRPHTPKPGVAFLAHHSGAAVIPVRVEGAGDFPFPGRLWIRFAEPLRFSPAACAPQDLHGAYRAFADLLMDRIYALTPGDPA